MPKTIGRKLFKIIPDTEPTGGRSVEQGGRSATHPFRQEPSAIQRLQSSRAARHGGEHTGSKHPGSKPHHRRHR